MGKDGFSKKKPGAGKGGLAGGKLGADKEEKQEKKPGLAGGKLGASREDKPEKKPLPAQKGAGDQPAAAPPDRHQITEDAGAVGISDPEAAALLVALKSRISSLDDAVRLRDANREFSSTEATISKLPGEVEKVRSRGYAFRSFLENKARVMSERWQEAKGRAERAIEDESAEMRRNLEEVNTTLRRVEQGGAGVASLEAIVDRLEKKAESAKGSIADMTSTLRDDANQMTGQLREINWMCDRKDEASFDFLAGESMFLVAEAQWDDGGDKPEGFLFLTDQRLVFEQKQKVGKRLGMFGGKEVHEEKWSALLPQVEAVEAENKGMFGGKDMLYLTLGGGASYPKLTVEVKGGVDCKFWQKQVERMVSGDAGDERAIAPDPELIQRLRSAPTACHVCGGKLPVIVAGQAQIECEYCGSVVRI